MRYYNVISRFFDHDDSTGYQLKFKRKDRSELRWRLLAECWIKLICMLPRQIAQDRLPGYIMS